MKKRLGCFHAHHSNIEHIEKALKPYNIELIHFVDPGLDRIKMDSNFTEEVAQKKIKDTLEWISSCHVDAILITCTFFTANIEEDKLAYSIPIIKIDDPLFHSICGKDEPQILVFTNPNTVEGTMNQLINFATKQKKKIQVEPYLLENTFNLVMEGKKEEYIESVSNGLNRLIINHPDKIISAAQLSMVPSAENIESKTDTYVGNHLKSLSNYLEEILKLNVYQ
ncbi:hypothetical protein [Priestia megaterium]|uniref:hypothetical protein n=1 Tax=Priestia megaterium TaxID=1404 RepID=UPI002E1A16FC|nr:hypothetical protein [Priestia megaterium]MED4276030.1 hypothetical protein [Priestia megaterium]MED4319472.1 hypothetical protein [Priestia megaterium]